MTFLSVVTRHLVGREALLERNQTSLRAQTDPDYQHVVIPDEIGRGVEWANAQLAARRWDHLMGEYVMVLDDDNEVTNGGFIAALKAAAHGAGMLIWRVDIPGLGIIPPDDCWKRTPQRARIDANCAAVRRDIWLESVKAFYSAYDADYDYLAACYKAAGKVVWLDHVYTRAVRRSLGAV